MNSQKRQRDDVVIRLMKIEDIDAIQVIEHACFSLPWSETAFYNELKHNHFAHYVVIELDGRIIAYGGMWTIMDEAHVTNIAVHPDYQGNGWGTTIVEELRRTALFLGSKKMTLEVRVSNKRAQHLYQKMGFREAGIRKGYYSDNHEDALIMWADLLDGREEEEMT